MAQVYYVGYGHVYLNKYSNGFQPPDRPSRVWSSRIMWTTATCSNGSPSPPSLSLSLIYSATLLDPAVVPAAAMWISGRQLMGSDLGSSTFLGTTAKSTPFGESPKSLTFNPHLNFPAMNAGEFFNIKI